MSDIIGVICGAIGVVAAMALLLGIVAAMIIAATWPFWVGLAALKFIFG